MKAMVRANSLLYAIYICLIVAIICAAMLFMAGLYTQLNQYYVSHQNLYVHNESLVNFAVSHMDDKYATPDEDDTGILSSFEVKQYGVIPLVVAKSIMGNDTVASMHFVGCTSRDNTALYVPNYGAGISYSGNVKLLGNSYLPTSYVASVYLSDVPNSFYCSGKGFISKGMLPEPADNVVSGAMGIYGTAEILGSVEKEGKIINSFLKPPLVLNDINRVGNLDIKGNTIIKSSDSIVVSAMAKLEDVILMAPKIIFEDNFEGSVQAFATLGIEVGKNVRLKYPSVLYASNHSVSEKCKITINEGSSIYGLIIMYGNEYQRVDNNNVYVEANVGAFCDIYSTGNTSLRSNVAGSVYTNRISYRTATSLNNNCVVNIDLGPEKRPGFFYSVPLFKANAYGVIKKLI
ncbi:hypothetical protein ACLI09_17050 [Flavobacterium sp. RHBU_24]|uniref:hypothetical protein n=1 Tax=Flavobacterium sp. RHBU_24 TaxID=3391185 RepID=UPI00398500C9